ncbi:uncharacterized protein B0P05DRAFT_543083, partial [Gilbertella persicaria]|uniref:uncharacterized protein n=1 Tax=Gilbertella persicaria TaxID=101096 RepID=UPI00221F8CC4
MRGKRGNVCITNRYETSQTYIYCFKHPEHPCFVEKKKKKEMIKRFTTGRLMLLILNMFLSSTVSLPSLGMLYHLLQNVNL